MLCCVVLCCGMVWCGVLYAGGVLLCCALCDVEAFLAAIARGQRGWIGFSSSSFTSRVTRGDKVHVSGINLQYIRFVGTI